MKMNKTKKQLVTLFTMVFILLCLAIGSSALEGVLASDEVVKIADPAYYEYEDIADDFPLSDDPGTNNPWLPINNLATGAYINMSKSIEEIGDNEFRIDLNIETVVDFKNIFLYEPASVVLVLNVSESMDSMVARNGLNLIRPGQPGWNLSGTRWSIMKEATKDFIEALLRNPNNQVSIVVYGGEGDFNHDPWQNATVHDTICEWTNSAKDAIESFDIYRFVSTASIMDLIFAGYDYNYNELTVRRARFSDNARDYGFTNSQAGFIGAGNLLRNVGIGGRNIVNNPFVINMADAEADRSYDDPRDIYSAKPVENGIKEAGKLKDEFDDCTLFTVGFSEDAQDSLVLQKSIDGGADGKNPYVDEYFPAAKAGDLSVVYEKILREVYELSKAWMVTDPMSEYVKLKEVSTAGDNKFSVDANDTITWDLLNSEPVYEVIEGFWTKRTYVLSYTIEVDPEKLNKGDYEKHPTNEPTELTYAFLSSDLKEVLTGEKYFLVPGLVIPKPEGSIKKEALDEKGEVLSEGVLVGDVFTYAITLNNSKRATEAWEEVWLTDTIPDGLKILDYEVEPTGRIDKDDIIISGQNIKVPCGDIAINETVVVKIIVEVVGPPTDGEKYTNRAVASNDKDDDMEATVEVYPKPDGSIRKVADVDDVRVGDGYTYTITLANDSIATVDWKGVELEDKLPADGSGNPLLEWVSYEVVYADGSSDSFTFNDMNKYTSPLSITIGDIGRGEKVEIE
ncbi:MAG: VWA domain-containing protein, partial [Clostridiales bacterium]|nr:VWA domain-containing protein [Clostridiales bacterium]